MLAPCSAAIAQTASCPNAVLNAGGVPTRGALTDAVLWSDFATWSRRIPRLPPDASYDLSQCYVRRLRLAGIDSADAARRLARLSDLRTRSVDHERLYWDTRFRLGGGPRDPLPLLVDAVAALRPGRALDAGMGLGRNALYLAARGWQVTGYDFSREAIAGAKVAARQKGVTVNAVVSSHEQFDFGEEQWDLIVSSYASIGALDANWPVRLASALKPGGILILQEPAPLGTTVSQVRAHWSRLRMLRLDVLPVGEDWLAGGEQPTVKLVAQKPPAKR
jgi:SAM-dependent methyltransferase